MINFPNKSCTECVCGLSFPPFGPEPITHRSSSRHRRLPPNLFFFRYFFAVVDAHRRRNLVGPLRTGSHRSRRSFCGSSRALFIREFRRLVSSRFAKFIRSRLCPPHAFTFPPRLSPLNGPLLKVPSGQTPVTSLGILSFPRSLVSSGAAEPRYD